VKKIFLAIMLIIICGSAHASVRWLSPRGSDTNAGTDSSSTGAWLTLQYADGRLYAGDTLFVLGGMYTNNDYFSAARSGTSGSPIVVKAYGDSPAIFSIGFAGMGAIFYIAPGYDHITFDGTPYLPHADSLCIKLQDRGAGNSDIGRAIAVYGQTGSGAITDPCEYITIKGIHIDGYGTTPRFGTGILFRGVRNSTISNCLIDDINAPTGPYPPGNNTNPSQGDGEGIFLEVCQFIDVHDNTLRRMNHGSISLGYYSMNTPSYGFTQYCRIQRNFIDQGWGGGIYLTPARYTLVGDNVIVNCGNTTSTPKPGIQVSGSRNTIRRNVIYSPGNPMDPDSAQATIDMEAQTAYGNAYLVDSCLVYNNTVLHGSTGIKLLLKDQTSPSSRMRNNRLFNNIFAFSHGNLGGPSDYRTATGMYIDQYSATETNDYMTSCIDGSVPEWNMHWSGHEFGNNLFYRTSRAGPDRRTVVTYTRASTCHSGGWWAFDLDSLEARCPSAWYDNVRQDPLLISTSPAEYGLKAGWWRLQAESPAIDAGVEVTDDIGNYVNSIYPGKGWSSLEAIGSAPDIGAHEYESEEEEDCEIICTAPARDTILHRKAQWVRGSDRNITWDADGPPNSKIELYKGGSLQGVIAESTPNDGVYSWNVNTFGGALDDDYSIIITAFSYPPCADTTDNFEIIGTTSCSVYPLSLSFGNIAIGDSTATQTVLITNTGDYTLSGTIVDSSPDFEITSGGGYCALTPFQTRTVAIRFKPLTGGAKSGHLFSFSECSTVIHYGGALDISPATIAFPNTAIGTCSDPLVLIISNTGSGTISGTISESCPHFEIVSGAGEYSLSTGQTRTLYIRFCPTSMGNKVCEINY